MCGQELPEVLSDLFRLSRCWKDGTGDSFDRFDRGGRSGSSPRPAPAPPSTFVRDFERIFAAARPSAPPDPLWHRCGPCSRIGSRKPGGRWRSHFVSTESLWREAQVPSWDEAIVGMWWRRAGHVERLCERDPQHGGARPSGGSCGHRAAHTGTDWIGGTAG